MVLNGNWNYFIFPQEYDGAVTGGYYSYQTDEKGDIKLYSTYHPMAYDIFEEYIYRDTFVFGDFDGDGKPEIGNRFDHLHIYFPERLYCYTADNMERISKLQCPSYLPGRYSIK